ncbi:MAG: cyclophilin-like fold protein [Thermoplasmata archaeon]|nr:cyclophilin-like fold protein [Thermoplasmata archaeon]
MTGAAWAAIAAVAAVLVCAGAWVALSGNGGDTSPGETAPDTEPEDTEETDTVTKILMTVGDETFTITLADTDAAHEFASMLPMTLSMSDLNWNEKYAYLDTSLTASSSRVGAVSAGDLMLFGEECVVVFYESFSTSYTYTRLGTVDDPSGLAEALGSGSVTVTFSAA